jgi:hypothetical protein
MAESFDGRGGDGASQSFSSTEGLYEVFIRHFIIFRYLQEIDGQEHKLRTNSMMSSRCQSIDRSKCRCIYKDEAKPASTDTAPDDKKLLGAAKQPRENESKSQSVLNKPFDEALEFSQSGSDESVDTETTIKGGRKGAAEARAGHL